MSKTSVNKLLRIPQSLRDSISRTRVDYCHLGNCGLRVYNPILGGLHIGNSRWLPWVLNEEEWDTANVYSNGESEKVIAKALRKYNIPRSKVILMTKCYRVVCDSENFDPGSGVTMHHELADKSKDYVNQWGLSRAAIFNAVEASLERLGTHYINIFQIHHFDPTVPIAETMSALNDLVKAGMVRYLGASSMWTYQFAAMQNLAHAKGWTKFFSMQNHYNLIYREEENGSIYEAEDCNTDKIVSRVEEIAVKRNWPMSHVALTWLNKRVTAPIIGFSTVQRIEEALAAVGKELSEDGERYLEELYVPRPIQGHS
ncbi:hypothetical protein LRP88_03813 [Fusarium phalaenopsidis]